MQRCSDYWWLYEGVNFRHEGQCVQNSAVRKHCVVVEWILRRNIWLPKTLSQGFKRVQTVPTRPCLPQPRCQSPLLLIDS